MERCIGIQWGPGLLRPFDGPPPFGVEFQPGQEILALNKDSLKLHYKHGDAVSHVVLRRAGEVVPIYSVVVRRDQMVVEPFLVWGRPDQPSESP